MTLMYKEQIENDGWDAYWSGKTIKDCPWVPASEEASYWVMGYSMAHDAAEEDKDEFIMDFIDS